MSGLKATTGIHKIKAAALLAAGFTIAAAILVPGRDAIAQDAAKDGGKKKGGGRGVGGLGNKSPDYPANLFVSASTVAHTPLRHEFVDIAAGKTKLHTWIEYPAGEAKAPVVILMHYDAGLDVTQRALADQIALSGFIAVAPDLWSGTGPNGGGRDSFDFVDDAMRAGVKINADEAQRRYKIAREWALKLPRANGKTGSIGFCAGGGNSFRFAGEVPALTRPWSTTARRPMPP